MTKMLTPAAVLATLLFAATPAGAGQHGGSHSRGWSGGYATSRGSAPRLAAPRAFAPRALAPRTFAPRAFAPSRSVAVAPRVLAQSRGVYAAQRRGAIVRVGPRGIAPRGVVYPRYRFYRPYYTFRSRFSIGFGLLVGYPVAYPYYGYPYAYSSPYGYGYPAYYAAPPYGYATPSYGYAAPSYGAATPSYGYPGTTPSSGYPPAPAQGSVAVQTGGASGGISLEISPTTAEVYVDGTYVGRVSDVGPMNEPLTLTPGRHRIEVRAPGYQTLSIDSDVKAGEVIPYQGAMQPVRPQ